MEGFNEFLDLYDRVGKLKFHDYKTFVPLRLVTAWQLEYLPMYWARESLEQFFIRILLQVLYITIQDNNWNFVKKNLQQDISEFVMINILLVCC